MLLASTFMFSWFSVLLPFAVTTVVVIVAGVMIGSIRGRLGKWQIRVLMIVFVLTLTGCEVGFAAAEANQHNSLVASQRFVREVTSDLRSEHFRISSIDDYLQTVVLLVGRFNCELPPLTVSHTASRHDSTVKWRPTLPAAKRQFGLESVDLQSMAKACSAG